MHEILQYWKSDESTKVIGVYLEGLADPRRFIEVAREVSAVKPVIIFKSGRSELGSSAALSHTGAVAGADAIYDGAFRQADMIRAHSVAEFYDTLRAFSRQPEPRGNRVCVVTHMGGPGTICMDGISVTPELQLAEFSPATVEAIKAIVSPAANVGHPSGYIDLTAATTERLHADVLKLLLADDNVDMVIQILAPSAFLNQPLLARETAAAFESQAGDRKPLLNVVTFGGFGAELRHGLEQTGLPVFDFSDSVTRVAGNLARHGAIRSRAAAGRRATAAPTKPDGPAAELIANALQQRRVSLLEHEAYEVCRQYGIQVPPFSMVDSAAAAREAAKVTGYPLVLKVASAEILHKSDIGGVMLGIGSDQALDDAYAKLVENVRRAAPHIERPGVLVQAMMPATTELVLGGLRDPLFGATVMAGMGGIYVEILKRVGFRLAPLGVEEAVALIRETLPAGLIAGARGRDPMNVESIAEAVVALGRLFSDFPQIAQVDLNPFLPYRDRAVAVDARFILAD
jgi:acetyltransferase